MDETYYLCFTVNTLPDLTLSKYSVFDGSSVNNIIEKHRVFLRQLYRLGYTSGVYFHLLYYYNPDNHIPKGSHLSIIFYATAQDKEKLDGIREFLTTSVLSTYYEFFCYEIAREFTLEKEYFHDGSSSTNLRLVNISGRVKKYGLGGVSQEAVREARKDIELGRISHIVCEIAPDINEVRTFNGIPVDDHGKFFSVPEKRFSHGAFLTRKDYALPAQNRLSTDKAGEVMLYSIMEWEPSKTGRLYNVLKLMEGYNQTVVLRIDVFPIEHTQKIRERLPYAETRRRLSDRNQGRDDNSENIIKSWDRYLDNLMKFPQFFANVVAFADSQDVAVMLVDSVAAEAVESGTYLIETMNSRYGFSMYDGETRILHIKKEDGNYVAPFLSLYTLEEIRPMFSFPVLYPGETIERRKETDPVLFSSTAIIDYDTGVKHEVISLGISDIGHEVFFPVELFKKHAFVAGVPGSGKTNTLSYLVTTLWRDTEQHIPFLVLEPAKQEYRALAMIEGMERLCIFSPGADTYFPLHINPFQFPVGLTLAEHIANLNAVFAGAFELIPPSPFLIDACIERVYLDKGWNTNERNDGSKQYPTMQELYDSLREAVENSGYEGEVKANIRSVMEVRIGSLLRREIGNVYNVKKSSIEPKEWLDNPIIIELEALGEGPANFMSLLISTLIREELKVRKTSDFVENSVASRKKTFPKREIEHIIFYEEAHNLIGSDTDDPVGISVNPKISATKYLVKMLAEVRALNEGIVIADQLPTAMAAEILKNTGLKIGHRITAQDDRVLLGSTMSASAEQLDEQGIFSVGQALIFYEDLLKPFKMKVHQWERGKKVFPPTNAQLFNHVKNNETYNILLKRSADIMKEKMMVEFDALTRRALSLKESIKGKHGRREALIRELKKLCWDYVNLYYTYMTLSKNYSIFSNDMCMCTIINFWSLFASLKSLSDTPDMQAILLKETDNVIKDISRYIDLSFESKESILSNHPEYRYAIYLSNYYLLNKIVVEAYELSKRAKEILALDCDAVEELKVFGIQFSENYFRILNIAKKYCTVAQELSRQNYALLESYMQGTAKWAETNQRAVECNDRKFVLYKALVAYVIKVFECISAFDGNNRRMLCKQTIELLKSFRKIVDYRNSNTNVVLSNCSQYLNIWKGTKYIRCMEMVAKAARIHQLLMDSIEKIESDGFDDLKEVCKLFNIFFLEYSEGSIDSFEDDYEYCHLLVNQYGRYLRTVLQLGEYTHVIIKTSSANSRLNWLVCFQLIEKLDKYGYFSDSEKVNWTSLSVIMQNIFFV